MHLTGCLKSVGRLTRLDLIGQNVPAVVSSLTVSSIAPVLVTIGLAGEHLLTVISIMLELGLTALATFAATSAASFAWSNIVMIFR